MREKRWIKSKIEQLTYNPRISSLYNRLIDEYKDYSPSAAFDAAYTQGLINNLSQLESLCLAKAVRWNLVLKRDYEK